MIDIGIVITGIAAFIAFIWGRGRWMRHALFLSWAVVAVIGAIGADKAETVFTLAAMDLAIAGVALFVVTADETRTDAKIVGAISIALMPAHVIMSATHGIADWTLYASALNAGFVLQCLIVRGWLDGLGRTARGFFARLRPVFVHRIGGG